MMKTINNVIPIILIVFFTAAYVNAAQEFVCSKTSNKYHYPTCKWAKEIRPDKLMTFDSPETAHQAGYIPCPTCKPPLPKDDKNTHHATSTDIDKKHSEPAPDKGFQFNIAFGFLLLLLLLFVPFVPGLIEIMIERDAYPENDDKKDSA